MLHVTRLMSHVTCHSVVNDIDSDSLHIVVCDDTACGSDRGSTEMLEECHKTAAAGDRKTHGINR